MAGLFLAVFLVIAFLIVKNASSPQTGGVAEYDRLYRGGIRGRGLVLASSVVSRGITVGMRRFERRTMTIEVEVPSMQPWTVQGDFLVPRGLVEPIPGSSLDVAVDSVGGSRIAILGPGGFTGDWLNMGPPQPY